MRAVLQGGTVEDVLMSTDGEGVVRGQVDVRSIFPLRGRWAWPLVFWSWRTGVGRGLSLGCLEAGFGAESTGLRGGGGGVIWARKKLSNPLVLRIDLIRKFFQKTLNKRVARQESGRLSFWQFLVPPNDLGGFRTCT